MTEKKKEKKFSKYFGGEYMKYWYVAFVIVLGIMFFDMYNDRNVEKYKLIIYDNSGSVVKTTDVQQRSIESLTLKLPITKSFRPVKQF